MNKDHDMLIRHDIELKALSRLPDSIHELAQSIGKLKTNMAVMNAKAVAVMFGICAGGSILGCAGTWVVMIYFERQ